MPTSGKPAFERDPVKLDAKHYKAELENDRVRVVRIKYGGKEGSVMHSAPSGGWNFPDRRPLQILLSGR
jgi:hypothetical protein